MKEYLAQIVAAHPGSEATNAMREYLQARILESLQKHGAWRSLAFMGGTALRFLYQLPRFSEDLDFSLEDPSDGFDLRAQVQAACAQFEREGYDAHARISTKATVHKAFLVFRGLEHELGLSVDAGKTLSIKVEVDTRPPAGAVLETTMVRRYVTLRLTHHDKASLLAGKAAALLCRDWIKGRDVYDLVWYLSDPTWPEPNERLLAETLRQMGREDLASEPMLWKAALGDRLRAAAWEHVLQDVERFLERPADAWMVERDAVMSVMKRRGWTE